MILMGLAAAVLYILSKTEGKSIKQEVIANAAGITDVTLRARTKEVKNKLAHQRSKKLIVLCI